MVYQKLLKNDWLYPNALIFLLKSTIAHWLTKINLTKSQSHPITTFFQDSL